MDAVSVYPSIFILAIALLTAWAISFFQKKEPLIVVKYQTIEGLRGYLALFVFICHACAYYYYIRNGKWQDPPSHLYSQFGYTSVALFFMITGFLFSSKLIDGKKSNIDWTRLVISRILRLTPLYLAALGCLLIIVAILSDFTLNEPLLRVVKRIIHWSAFTIFENPDINKIKDTWIILSGVTWTFIYEWLFYFSLPLLGVLFYRTNYNLPILLIATCLTIFIVVKVNLSFICFCPFASGIIASLLVRSSVFCRYARKKMNAVLIVFLLITNTWLYGESFAWIPLLILSVVFILIACGNDLCGILTAKISFTLGKMAYSIYLLHGIILFITFHFILCKEYASSLSAVQHWLIISTITPVLLLICYTTYLCIEKPAMEASTRVAAYLQKQQKN